MKVALSGRVASDNRRANAMSSTVSVAPVSTIAVKFGRPPTEHFTTIKCPRYSLNGTASPAAGELAANAARPIHTVKTRKKIARFTTTRFIATPAACVATGVKLASLLGARPEERLIFPPRFSENRLPQLFLSFSTGQDRNLSRLIRVEF